MGTKQKNKSKYDEARTRAFRLANNTARLARIRFFLNPQSWAIAKAALLYELDELRELITDLPADRLNAFRNIMRLEQEKK